MIAPLQSLRGIFVLLIFLSHYHLNGTDAPTVFESGGDIGVAFFFLLSGFCLAMAYNGRTVRLGAFIGRRMAKFYPLHIVCYMAFLYLWTTDPLNGFLDLFLLQSWVPDLKVCFSMNPVAWYLSSLIFCYLLFLPMQKLFERHPYGGTALFCAITISYLCLQPLMTDEAASYWIYIFPPSRLLDFGMGMLLFYLLKSRSAVTAAYAACSGVIKSVVEIMAIALLAGAIIVRGAIPYCYNLAAWWWLPEIFIIALFVQPHGGMFSRLLSWRPLVAFGNISLSFYLVHMLVMVVTDIIVAKLPFAKSPLLLFGATLCATVIAAALLERFVVKPCAAILLRHYPAARR